MTQLLNPYAENAAASRGRLHEERESHTRTPFARDRDRIIHSTAFRRLKGKTQVFVANEGELPSPVKSLDYVAPHLEHVSLGDGHSVWHEAGV